MERRTTVHVGLFAHDEESSLEACARAILAQRLERATVVAVTIVSCGSTDRTDEIARALEARDPRVKLLSHRVRRGKAHAINRFLAGAGEELLVLVSADTVLAEGSLQRLIEPFADETVGMTGVRPMPQNERRGVGAMVHLLWELHHRCAREAPKLGEAIALRRDGVLLPAWTRADEVSLEADVVLRRKLRLVYCERAIAHNRGPDTLADYVEHRTRIAAAHREIERTGYRPATRDPLRIARVALAFALERPAIVPTLWCAAVLEAYAWVRGVMRARPRDALGGDGAWKRIDSAKRAVISSVRASAPLP